MHPDAGGRSLAGELSVQAWCWLRWLRVQCLHEEQLVEPQAHKLQEVVLTDELFSGARSAQTPGVQMRCLNGDRRVDVRAAHPLHRSCRICISCDDPKRTSGFVTTCCWLKARVASTCERCTPCVGCNRVGAQAASSECAENCLKPSSYVAVSMVEALKSSDGAGAQSASKGEEPAQRPKEPEAKRRERVRKEMLRVPGPFTAKELQRMLNDVERGMPWFMQEKLVQGLKERGGHKISTITQPILRILRVVRPAPCTQAVHPAWRGVTCAESHGWRAPGALSPLGGAAAGCDAASLQRCGWSK
jgi:hypothetical protein